MSADRQDSHGWVLAASASILGLGINVTSHAGMFGLDLTVPRLEAALRNAPGGALALQGMRGLGKTTLARALCASMQQSFPGRTCLIEFPTLAEQLSSTEWDVLLQKGLQQLGIQQAGVIDFQKVLARQWISMCRSCHCVLYCIVWVTGWVACCCFPEYATTCSIAAAGSRQAAESGLQSNSICVYAEVDGGSAAGTCPAGAGQPTRARQRSCAAAHAGLGSQA